MSDPITISWRDALQRIIEMGYADDAAGTMLVEAVVSNAVRYYPRRAMDLGRPLFDPMTGAWRMHRRDSHPFLVRPVRSDFERWLLQLRRPSKAGSESKAIEFLSPKLEADHDLKLDDAWSACQSNFPNLSKRRFRSHVWPEARTRAGLDSRAPAGRKKRRP
jgi:hypothetical protein